MRRAALALVALALAFVPTAARGDDVDDAARAAARELASRAVKSLDDKDYAAAAQGFERAYKVLKVPTIGLFLGESLEHLGRLVEAAERYREVLGLALPAVSKSEHEKAQAEAKKRLPLVEQRLAHVAVLTPGAPEGATVTLDDKPILAALVGVELPVDPGAHVAELKSGERATHATIKIGEGESTKIELVLEAAPSPKPAAPAPPPPTPVPAATPRPTPPAPPTSAEVVSTSPLRVVGWIGVGAGVVGIGVGAVAGAIAIGQNATLDKSCTNDKCPASVTDDLAAYRRDRALGTVGFVAGGVLLAAGVTLLVVAPKKAAAAASVRVGPARASLDVRF